MFPKENEHTEYKRELTDVLKKEVIAFANTSGGSIYIGIADDGTVVGVSDSDQTMLRLASMLRDSIHPDIMMFTDMRVEQIEQHDVIHLTIASGTNKPYYLISKGLKPSGVYVRQGSASVPASPEQIRQLIKTADGDVMEDNISLNQELTFQKTTAIFAAKGLQLAGEQKFSLGLQRHDGVYTNLGLLLSDQCPFTIKTAVFSGTNQKNFQDRREFSGPLFSQLEDCYAYLQLNNPTTAEFSGLYRNDFKAYPDDALREALLNCIIHRDYAFSSSILISIYDNRMEFTSIGGLMPGLEKADIMLGISLCRNPKLANIFYRLELIEAYGTGLPKIKNAYSLNADQPEFLTAPHVFKVILPRLEKGPLYVKDTPISPEEQTLKFIQAQKTVTRKDVEELLCTSTSTATRVLLTLINQGHIHRTGRGKQTKYIFNG
ncbi:MAG: putative DNA binding domain-containing protein [Selenomonas sp.]|nr:putative DNA binding domain-containing protein [Selenomonas sp.]